MTEEMDPAFTKRDRLRKAGLPVEIARTKRLVIRETVMEDVPELYRMYKEPGMERFIRPMQETLEEELEFMRAYISHAYLFYDFGLWTVLEKDGGQIVGRAGLFLSELLDDAVELGYLIGQKHQKKGYAREAGRAILSYAGEVLDLEEIHLLCDCQNTASIRTAKALGLRRTGCLRAEGKELTHFLWNDGQSHETVNPGFKTENNFAESPEFP